MRNISKYLRMREYFQIFSDEGVLLNSFVEIHCSTAEEGLDQNRMAVNVMGGLVLGQWRSQMNKPIHGRIIETRVRIYSF